MRRLAPGRWIDVAAGRVAARKTHYDELVLRGPGYSGARFVKVEHGVAAAETQLPRQMAPGTWTIAIIDSSKVRISHHRVRGRTQVRIATFKITAAHRRHHR
jgi:hypothetical protein